MVDGVLDAYHVPYCVKVDAWEKHETLKEMRTLRWKITFPDKHTEMTGSLLHFCKIHQLQYAEMRDCANRKILEHQQYRVQRVPAVPEDHNPFLDLFEADAPLTIETLAQQVEALTRRVEAIEQPLHLKTRTAR